MERRVERHVFENGSTRVIVSREGDRLSCELAFSGKDDEQRMSVGIDDIAALIEVLESTRTHLQEVRKELIGGLIDASVRSADETANRL